MIKNKLRHILIDQDLSIVQLAEQIGVTYSTVYDFANMRRRSVQYSLIDAICEALNIQPGDMLIYGPGQEDE